jgi:hypothetical protein
MSTTARAREASRGRMRFAQILHLFLQRATARRIQRAEKEERRARETTKKYRQDHVFRTRDYDAQSFAMRA